jgi:hypothetical protein
MFSGSVKVDRSQNGNGCVADPSNVSQTLYTVTVDTEEEWDWAGQWPQDNLQVTNILELPKFQKLCTNYGVRPTYFTDLAVLQHAESREVVTTLAKAEGVEIGMHIHPWNTPPVAIDTIPTNRSTFLRNLPVAEIGAKLASVYDGLSGAGIRPTSFRGGRYSSGGAIHEFLQDHGFVADCSVVPYTTWPDDGAPDYRQRDLAPARIPATRSGQTALWELPLTLAFSRRPFRLWQRSFEAIERSMLRKLRLIGIAERLGIVRKVWLNFEIADPCDWMPFLRLLRQLRVPCICFTVHSSSLAAGPGPYTKNADDEERIYRQIENIFSLLSRWPEFVPATASEVALELEQRYAGSRN